MYSRLMLIHENTLFKKFEWKLIYVLHTYVRPSNQGNRLQKYLIKTQIM